MNWFKKQYQNFQKKPLWSKVWDILFYAIIALLLFPGGREMVQRTYLNLLASGPDEFKVEGSLKTEDWRWTFTNINEVPGVLNEYKGKVLFINFWATWCGPCKAEMPSIQDLYDQYRNDDRIQFMLMSYEDAAKVRTFMLKNNYDIPVYLIKQRAPETIYAEALPTTFIIDREGNIVHRSSGMAKWNAKSVTNGIDNLLGNVVN